MSIRRALIIATVILLARTLPVVAGEIHDAIEAGDRDRVADLLATDATLIHAQAENSTFDLPIHTASIHGRVEIARLLLDAGANIEGLDSDESTPLGVAAVFRQAGMVHFLLANGADVNRRDKNGAYPLSFAASGGDSSIVQTILDAGADLNLKTRRGHTLAHYAVTRNLTDLFDILIARGVDIQAGNNEGETPLHWAATRGQLDMVKRLVEAGASVAVRDSGLTTPLLNAAWGDHVEVARYLIDQGAEIDAMNQFDNSPLLAAAWRGYTDFGKLLLERGADPNFQDLDGDTPLINAARSGSVDLARAIVEAGGRTDMRESHDGRAALHFASLLGYDDVAEMLVTKGAPVNQTDGGGSAPLDLASCYGHKQLAKMLSSNGARAEQPDAERVCDLTASSGFGNNEADIFYLGHSGWGVKTRNHLLVFDYAERGRRADEPGIANGHINPTKLADENVMVFASHVHGDHYVAENFEWRESIKNITYVMGFEPEEVPAYEYIPPRETRTIDGVKITAIESNDSGEGFVVEVDGLVIFHPGDHANRLRDLSGTYTAEIDFLAAAGVRPDIAFMPISGCNFGDLEAVRLGVHYTCKALQPKLMLPMHAGGSGHKYRDFVAANQDESPGTHMMAACERGDVVHYGNGKATD